MSDPLADPVTSPANRFGAHDLRPAVVLIGPPGSGKTSVGRAVARLTGLPLRDTDADVEAVAGRTISDIFANDGEETFRAMEAAAVADALATHPGVLSLGGGAVLAASTRDLLAGHTVVYLAVSMPTGVRRTGLADHRPLLVGLNPRATYKALLDARIPLYRSSATYEIDTDGRTVAQIAAEIVERAGLS